MVDFMRHLLVFRPFVQIWVAGLFLTNLAAVLFLPRVEAWVILVGLMTGGLLQNLLFARYGFVRLLGLGHVYWVAMIPWLLARLSDPSVSGSFSSYITAVIVVCGVSVAIDIVDVARYLSGDRAPVVSLSTAR